VNSEPMPAKAHHRPEPALYHQVADPGSLAPFAEEIEAGNPSGWPGYASLLRRARLAAGARHAVTTGLASVGGHPCVLVGFEYAFIGGTLGVAEGTKIARAFSAAVARRLPVVSVAASGGARMQEGTSALVQMQVIAAAVASARNAGIPHVAVAGDPTTGGVWSSLVAGADVVLAVTGARVSFSGTRTRPAGADPGSPHYDAAGQWERGMVDAVVPAAALSDRLAVILGLLSPRSRGDDGSPPCLEPAGTASKPIPDAWAQVSGARTAGAGGAEGGAGAAGRGRAEQWLAAYFGASFEIRGDRCGGVDTGLRCGFGARDGATVGYIAQTGQPTTAAGFRTATRLVTLATRFRRPVLTLVDTPGASAMPGDEAAGVGPAIAELLVGLASAQVPVTSVVVGEGVSGGAIALASPASLWLAPGGYLAVTTPEYAASILKLPASEVPRVATRLRLTPADLIRRGIVRGLVQPPAHPDPAGS
jgi:acyl-CoA carboxylase subunit beta